MPYSIHESRHLTTWFQVLSISRRVSQQWFLDLTAYLNPRISQIASQITDISTTSYLATELDFTMSGFPCDHRNKWQCQGFPGAPPVTLCPVVFCAHLFVPKVYHALHCTEISLSIMGETVVTKACDSLAETGETLCSPALDIVGTPRNHFGWGQKSCRPI